MRKLISLLLLSAVLCPLSALAQGDTLAPIVRNLESGARAIAVQSPDEATQRLLARAFEAHGAFRLADTAQAAFVFRVEPLPGNKARLTIQSGSPLQTLFTQEVTGRNARDAALRAADLAVSRTTKETGKETPLPGIFAGQLAFISERSGNSEVYLGDLFFTDVRRLTSDKANCTQPNLSPDGKRILYTSYYRNGFPDIYQIDVASGRREPFMSFSGTNTSATFSPDGQRVAMILSGTGNAELYVSNAQGRDLKRLTHNKSLEADPAWSPDGRSLILASDAQGRKPQLHRISAQGGTMERLPTNISGYCAEPTWNPRNNQLVAFTISQGGEFEVALYDMASKQSRTITRGAGDAVEPVWTRDGRHLIYTERTPNHRRLVLLDTETGSKAYLHDRAWGDSGQADYVYP